MTSPRPETPQIAVWYFVGATFAFASTALFIPNAPLGVRIATMVLGFALVVAGGVQLGRELRARRTEPTPPDTDTLPS